MLSIYLYDHVKEHLSYYQQIIQHCVLFKDWDINFVCYTTDSEELLLHLENQTDIGIYFLDIDLEGFDLAEKIRQHDPRGFLVFITTQKDLCENLHEHGLEALGCIFKTDPDNMEAKIEVCLHKAYNRYINFVSDNKSYLSLKSSKSIHFVKLDDVVLIRTSVSAHKIEIMKKDEIIPYNGSLKQIEKNLDHHFCRIHQSYIINSLHIKEIDKIAKTINMDNKTVISISYSTLKRILNKKI